MVSVQKVQRFGGGGGIRTHGDLSATPVFKFDGIASASVRTEQFCRLVSPQECILPASIRPLGGQGGGQGRGSCARRRDVRNARQFP